MCCPFLLILGMNGNSRVCEAEIQERVIMVKPNILPTLFVQE
ncbi:Uncharacterised protein [uncultured Ruminococcus sp.]|nr:Uncharacterised protein [uncultured Clostridium sp.]SCI06204.1 Uncharacterised protein [uncultured Ruminococcus sp.]